MKHKPHLNLKEQVEQLQNRNLTITNQENSAKYLSAISYHRFNSYRFAFLENDKISKEYYQKNTTFEDVINLYNEDIEYKNCLNILIQFIEIAFKTKAFML
jgi:abortive infection bacteriophage resistance protein